MSNTAHNLPWPFWGPLGFWGPLSFWGPLQTTSDPLDDENFKFREKLGKMTTTEILSDEKIEYMVSYEAALACLWLSAA